MTVPVVNKTSASAARAGFLNFFRDSVLLRPPANSWRRRRRCLCISLLLIAASAVIELLFCWCRENVAASVKNRECWFSVFLLLLAEDEEEEDAKYPLDSLTIAAVVVVVVVVFAADAWFCTATRRHEEGDDENKHVVINSVSDTQIKIYCHPKQKQKQKKFEREEPPVSKKL